MSNWEMLYAMCMGAALLWVGQKIVHGITEIVNDLRRNLSRWERRKP